MKLTAFIAACALVFNMTAATGFDEPKNKDKDRYCAKLKDGKITVFYENNTLTGTVTLTNGTQILTDGTVVKKDGTKVTLKEGECINKEGAIEAPSK